MSGFTFQTGVSTETITFRCPICLRTYIVNCIDEQETIFHLKEKEAKHFTIFIERLRKIINVPDTMKYRYPCLTPDEIHTNVQSRLREIR